MKVGDTVIVTTDEDTFYYKGTKLIIMGFHDSWDGSTKYTAGIWCSEPRDKEGYEFPKKYVPMEHIVLDRKNLIKEVINNMSL